MSRALNPIEHLFTGPGSQPITFAFSYATTLDPELLGRGLDDVLRFFPLARSTLVRTSAEELGLEEREAGLAFEVRRTDSPFERRQGALRWVTPAVAVEGQPQTRITLSRTPEGSVLAASMSHALADGFSYFHFLSSWARACRGERFLEPSKEGGALRPAAPAASEDPSESDMLARCGLFYGGDRGDSPPAPESCERYFVADEEIRPHLGASLSQNDVVTALLWKRYLGSVAVPSGDRETFLTCPVDVRRLTPGLPRTYFGCALCFATASIDLEGLRAASVGELALRVKEAVHRVRGAFVPDSMEALDSLRKRRGLAALRRVHLRHPSRGLIVTNLTRMPIRDVDFGSGPPQDFSTYVDLRGGAAILPAEGGVEVLVSPPGPR